MKLAKPSWYARLPRPVRMVLCFTAIPILMLVFAVMGAGAGITAGCYIVRETFTCQA